jgi:hypothetical protein
VARISVKIVICSLFLAVLAEGSARSEIYQYVDDAGVIHFTNVPTESTKKNSRVRFGKQQSAPPSILSARADAAVPQPTEQGDLVPAAYLKSIHTACEKYGVDPSLVRAIVKVESDYNPFALSRKGAMGLMQLMPQTATDLNVKNSFDPHENIHGGVRYLRYLLDRYEGNLKLALAAYNSGETAVKRWGTVPPFRETREYVKKVLGLYHGTGTSAFAPRFTIYVGQAPDGPLILTDNPSNHPDRKLHRKMERNL